MVPTLHKVIMISIKRNVAFVVVLYVGYHIALPPDGGFVAGQRFLRLPLPKLINSRINRVADEMENMGMRDVPPLQRMAIVSCECFAREQDVLAAELLQCALTAMETRICIEDQVYDILNVLVRIFDNLVKIVIYITHRDAEL